MKPTKLISGDLKTHNFIIVRLSGVDWIDK